MIAKNSGKTISFDDILESVGSNGKYQKIFTVVIAFGFCAVVSFAYMSFITALSVPEHWCHVPGRNLTNYTLEEWKSMTIPMTQDSKGKSSYSKCEMYNISQDSLQNIGTKVDASHSIIGCLWGWDYDKTWFEETIISREDWVCDKDSYATNVLAFGRIVEVVGSFVVSYLGDNFGRKPVCLYMSLILLAGRLLLLVSGGKFAVFVVSVILGSFASVTMMVSALIIGLEIHSSSSSAIITMHQANGWGVGLAILNLYMWYFRHWVSLIICCTILFLIYALCYRYVVESPKWLISKGKINRCLTELKTIAKVNKVDLPEDLDVDLTILSNQTKCDNYNLLDFFSNWRMCKNSVCLIICWGVGGFSYFALILNALNVGDNIFLSAFWQAIAELPANVFGMLGCNYLGRRFTQAGGHAGTVLGCVILMFTIGDSSLNWLNVFLASFLKFTTALSIYCAYVHTAEIYPTYLRQSSITMGVLTISLSSVLSPFLVYMGTKSDARYFYAIMGAAGVVAVCCNVLLPETLYETLPETLEEARRFGAERPLFACARKRDSNDDCVEKVEKV